jgi:DsbC/DsbD-like thiol-disulfide interchange protein
MTRVVLLVLLLATAAQAAPFASDWSVSAKSRARLIADSSGAGLEIELAPGAITYWRDPGEAGVPPSFDFSGSQNLGHAEVEFPPPERIPEPDGSVAFGYRESVILPIAVTPADPSKPVRLAARVDYGVCEKICLPAKAQGELTLAPGDSPFAPALAKARAQTPARLDPAALGATVAAQGAKSWRLCLADPPRDLFVEPPEGYWIEPMREPDGRCYALALKQTPEGAQGPIDLRLTVARSGGAAETYVRLPGSG